MIQSLKFKKDYRCFSKDDYIKFSDGVNLLVGDNGSGKSTILKLLKGLGEKFHKNESEEVVNVCRTACSVYSQDFEKDNLRTLSYFGDDMKLQIASMFSSHGESVRCQLLNLRKKSADESKVVFLLDEPDMALSVVGAMVFVDLLKGAVENGNQVIASVHNPEIMKTFGKVICMHAVTDKDTATVGYNDYMKFCKIAYKKLKGK